MVSHQILLDLDIILHDYILKVYRDFSAKAGCEGCFRTESRSLDKFTAFEKTERRAKVFFSIAMDKPHCHDWMDCNGYDSK